MVPYVLGGYEGVKHGGTLTFYGTCSGEAFATGHGGSIKRVLRRGSRYGQAPGLDRCAIGYFGEVSIMFVIRRLDGGLYVYIAWGDSSL